MGEGLQMCARYAPTQPDPTQFPTRQSDHVPETRTAQGDGEQPTRVVSTITVEDISPIKYRKLRQHLLLPGSWWPQADHKGYHWGPLLPSSPRGGRTCYLEQLGEAGTSENISWGH